MLKSRICSFKPQGRRGQYNTTRSFVASARLFGYGDTIQNLKIGSHTRVIFQGFTGRQATANAKESIRWGTNIVGGVTPGKSGEHLGLPVLPTVRKAMEELKPDATGIYVAAHQAPAAIEEAIEAEVPLIVAVAEHIPIHDILRIHSILNTQSKSRLVGANSPGIISAIGHCRIGFQPLPCFMPGRVGIVAKSGTLSYEAVASTTRAGLGQSLCIGMGGDVIAGTNFVDALKIFEHDDDTDGIVLIGEIGGSAELEAADWIKDYRKRSSNPKPISAIIGGVQVTESSPAKVMGHAGAFMLPGDPDVQTKIKGLQNAGVTMVNHPSKFGDFMKKLLGSSGPVNSESTKTWKQQRRSMHTQVRHRPKLARPHRTQISISQSRELHLESNSALEFLCTRYLPVVADPDAKLAGKTVKKLLSIAVDRNSRTLSVLASPGTSDDGKAPQVKGFPFDYEGQPSSQQLEAILDYMGLEKKSLGDLTRIVYKLVTLHKEKEAVALQVYLSPSPNGLSIVQSSVTFDDAAFRSAKRQEDLQSYRNNTQVEVDDQQIEAEKAGIVYIKLAGEGNIGTLVNGAGLAMNTVDALADAGGKAANFLDTGGKATSETVKKSFQIILQDERVKVIFVNIFGGLTLGDMIANGIILAFSELQISLPVVVRIRGTNEAEGQKIIAESGLPLFAYDDFEEAAAKAIELANKA